MIPIKVLFDNVTKNNGWSGPEIITAVIAAMAVVASIVSIIVTIKWNRKKIDADLKAKARIDWIQNTRLETSALLTQLMKLNQVYSDFKFNSEKFDYKRSFRRLNESYEAINRLILYFGPDDLNENKNSSEIKCIDDFEVIVRNLNSNTLTNELKNDDIVIILNYLKKKLKEDEEQLIKIKNGNKSDGFENINEIEKIAYNLTNIFRLYFKIEWNRAKIGK